MSYTSPEREARWNFIRRVRRRMADNPELNTLMDGREFRDSLIWDVTDEMLEDFNSKPPQIGSWGVRGFPNISVLLDGVIGKLLEIRLPALARNNIDYRAGEVSIRYPQYELYLQLSQLLLRRYEEKAREYKFSKNIRNSIGAATAVPSTNALTSGSGYPNC